MLYGVPQQFALRGSMIPSHMARVQLGAYLHQLVWVSTRINRGLALPDSNLPAFLLSRVISKALQIPPFST